MWNGMRLQRFDEIVPAAPDRGQNCRVCATLFQSWDTQALWLLSTYYFRGSQLQSTYSTDSRLQEVCTLLVTCSIHPHIHWRHCTTLLVWGCLWTCFALNQILVWYKCNVLGENNDNAVALSVLLKNSLTLCKIEISEYLLCVRLSPDVVVYIDWVTVTIVYRIVPGKCPWPLAAQAPKRASMVQLSLHKGPLRMQS